MFFVLSKILDWFLSPLSWALVAMAACLLVARKSKAVLVTGGAALALLTLFSLPVVAGPLWRALEVPPRPRPNGSKYEAVVLLGGAVDHGATADSGQTAYNDNVERLLLVFELLRESESTVAVLSGGRGKPDDPVIEARALADQLVAWGIARDRLILEDSARNTRENATHVAAIARTRGFGKLLVVTSAFHVPRALDCFRAVGLDVDMFPVDFRKYDADGLAAWIPRAETLAASDKALREAAGRLVYWIVGYGSG